MYGKVSSLISKIGLGSCFNSCSELPLYNFIKILTNKDYRNLIRFGYPSKTELSRAWELIFSEYNNISENKQSTYLLTLLREYYSIPNKLAIIQTIVDNLALRHDPDLVSCLRALGFRHKYEPGDGLLNDLKITVTQAKGLMLKYRALYDDLERLQQKSKDAEPNDYDLILAQLSKWQGFRIDTKKTTVSEFVAIVKLFKEDNKPKK